MSTQEHLQFYIDGQWVPPAVPRTLCTKPESASTPMCAFIPKRH